MNEPAAIWALRRVVFDDQISITQNAILSQGSYALRGVLEQVAKLRAYVDQSPLANVYIAPEIPAVLSNLCYQAGLASTILFNDAKKGSKESEYAYRLRKERIDYVRQWSGAQGVEAPLLRDRNLRNSLTHIDEHLADALTKRPMTGWFIDVAIKSREWHAPDIVDIAFCRSYIQDEDKLVHLEHELVVSHLAAECQALLAVVFGVGTAHA